MNFKEYTIDEIGEIISGGTPKTSEEDYWEGSIPWITPKDLSLHKNVYIKKGARSITPIGLKKSSAKLVPSGAILLSTRAPIGYVAIADNELTTNQGFKNLVLKEGFDQKYIYYLLKSNKDYLEGFASGTTFKELSANAFKKIKFLIPEIEFQNKAGQILYALDKKIEINNDLISKLETFSNSLFKHWFIDFEFLNEHDQPYKSNRGEMVESELGMIPVTWTINSVGSLINEVVGGDWGKEEQVGNYDHLVSAIRGADLDNLNRGIYSKIPQRYILNKNYLKKKINPMDLVVEISGGSPTQSTGRISLITHNVVSKFNDRLISTNFCRVLRLVDYSNANYIYYWWKYMYDKGVFFQYENGTTGIKNFNLNSFLDSNCIALPSNNIIRKFNDLIEKNQGLIFNLGQENIKLTHLRDILLPKLFSGEIEVTLTENEK